MLDRLNELGAVDRVVQNFEEVNRYFIVKIAEQIRMIGELNATSINRITMMTEWGADITDITQRLAAAADISIQQTMAVYQRVLDDVCSDPRFAQALKHTKPTARDAEKLNRYVQAVSRQTAGRITNLSNTTIATQSYRDAVDKAVFAVSSGMTDYKSATRHIIQEVGYSGLQVKYPGGYKRRLDTAVRQNITDGARQIAQHSSDMMGEALRYDAFEISAHEMSAPDHEPIQGRVFLKEEFYKLQNGLPFTDINGRQYDAVRRSIAEWNCRHIAMSFSTKYSKRKWSDAQLDKWAADNAAGCTIDGRHYTTYGASQLMRIIETKVRREKDVAVAAKAAGDDVLRQQCQMRINTLMKRYDAVAKTSGLRPRRERTVVQGFRAVRVK